ncbi:MAG: hypothetical protein KDJ87_06060 [Rhizobiaceae bacterium]|nr:hypothetical protein [Rhizobiaceae bacterium]
MRLYIIGIMVGALGLVAANQVRAEERCGLMSDAALTVQPGTVEAFASVACVDGSGPIVN